MGRPSKSLESEFADALKTSNEEAAKLGCYSVEFDAMLRIHGGKRTALKLVLSPKIQGGMRKVCELGRPDLTTEAIMLRPEFQSLFSKSEIELARWRLAQVPG